MQDFTYYYSDHFMLNHNKIGCNVGNKTYIKQPALENPFRISQNSKNILNIDEHIKYTFVTKLLY